MGLADAGRVSPHQLKPRPTITFGGFDNGNSGPSATIDWNNAQHQKITVSEDTTLSFIAPSDGGGHFTLILEQGGAGNHTVTWPSDLKWGAGGVAHILTTVLGALDVVAVHYFDVHVLALGTNNFKTAV